MILTRPNNILTKNKTFRAAFVVGIAAIVASSIVTIINTSSGEYCADMNYCSRNYYNYPNACIEGGTYYCCGYSSQGSYTCGSFPYRSCTYVGTNYKDCTGLQTAQYVTGGIALVCLIVMVCVARQHKFRIRAEAAANLIQHDDQIVFTDNRPVPPQPPQPYNYAQPVPAYGYQQP
jgi:hypothetical protein